MRGKTVLPVLLCGIIVLLIYAVDWFSLIYRLTPWQRLEETPVIPAQINYFVADTPNLIGYLEQDTGANITCAQSVAYLQMDTGEMARCCNAEGRIYCLAGDFSTEIPPADAACTDRLRAAFGVPASLPEAKDYKAYGDCSESGNPQLTVVQLDASNRILWKTVSGFRLQILNGFLRCILGPALLALAAWSLYNSRKKPDPNQQLRRW